MKIRQSNVILGQKYSFKTLLKPVKMVILAVKCNLLKCETEIGKFLNGKSLGLSECVPLSFGCRSLPQQVKHNGPIRKDGRNTGRKETI